MAKEFSEDNFKKIFPFFVCIDKDLNVVDVGPFMQKMIGDIRQRKFADVFKFVRPSLTIENSFNSFLEHKDVVIILESIDFPLLTRFRGQFICQEKDESILYLCSPWITDAADLGFHNLLITDFAILDSISDYLLLLQSKQLINEEIRRIADELVYQRDELIEKNKTILELAEFPEQNPGPIMRVDHNGEMLYANNAAQKLIEDNDTLNKPFWQIIKARLTEIKDEYLDMEINCGQETYVATIVPIPDKKRSEEHTSELQSHHDLVCR